jgi:maltose alpha-D-glucosyltransferase/alpha-amylase
MMNTTFPSPSWLENAIFYQIYPQSFRDSNGDGIGDIPASLKNWITCNPWASLQSGLSNPCFESPFQDAGYDVSDYYKVAPLRPTKT